ncbi:glycosyltransferase [Pontimonas sp.]|nr:glycosyltransferase [Pontimonas sp.]MDA9116838.1 glycosyltransferase [Pontimonas sp.]
MRESVQPDVSVVIPHRGKDEKLEVCLEAIRAQTYPSRLLEVLIVLNEPEERVLTFGLMSNERVMWQSKLYSYAARNLGLLHSRGQIIALTDSDTIPERFWISNGASALVRGADIVAGRIELTFSRFPLTPAACYEKLFSFDQEKNARLGLSTTANLIAYKSVFHRYGLFNGAESSGEDFQWTGSASAQGARLIFADNVVVQHPARESLQGLIRKAARVASGFHRDEDALSRLGAARSYFFATRGAPPSLSKVSACSGREKIAAYSVAVLVWITKLWFFFRRPK